MMYATRQHIVDLHGAEFLLLVAGRGDEPVLSDERTATAIDNALAQASSECDGYISVRYAVPVSPVPLAVKNATINMAVYHLASTHDRMTDIIRERYKDALAYLRDVSAGRANLPLNQGNDAGGEGTTSQDAPGFGEITSAEPQFQRGGW